LEEAEASADMDAGTVRAADASVDFFGASGTAWVFAADAPGAPPTEITVRAPPEGNEMDVRLVIRPRTGGGRLRVRALDPDARPVPLLLVRVTTVLGTGLLVGPLAPDAPPAGPFAAGIVRVSAQPIEHPKDSGGLSPPDKWLLSADATATIEDGKTTDLSLRPAWGGRIRLTLRVPQGAAESSHLMVRAVPASGSGAPVHLLGQFALPEDPAQANRISSSWSSGGPTYAPTLLAPGTHRIEVAAGGEGWSKPVAQGLVTVRPREVVDLSLDLAAR
jgi:hypothetical protein